MKMSYAALALACVLPTAASAQAVVAVAAPAVATNGQAVLPANTEVLISLNSEINSKKVKVGQKFDVSVSRDVMVGNYIVIPRGTLGTGEVTYRTGKGAFGKSAKMEIDLRSLNMNGRDIPISGHFRQEGSGNTGATVAAVATVWVAAPFITGHSAVFEQGREFRAFTREALPITLQQAVIPVSPAGTVPTVMPVPAASPAPAMTKASETITK